MGCPYVSFLCHVPVRNKVTTTLFGIYVMGSYHVVLFFCKYFWKCRVILAKSFAILCFRYFLASFSWWMASIMLFNPSVEELRSVMGCWPFRSVIRCWTFWTAFVGWPRRQSSRHSTPQTLSFMNPFRAMPLPTRIGDVSTANVIWLLNPRSSIHSCSARRVLHSLLHYWVASANYERWVSPRPRPRPRPGAHKCYKTQDLSRTGAPAIVDRCAQQAMPLIPHSS